MYYVWIFSHYKSEAYSLKNKSYSLNFFISSTTIKTFLTLNCNQKILDYLEKYFVLLLSQNE